MWDPLDRGAFTALSGAAAAGSGLGALTGELVGDFTPAAVPGAARCEVVPPVEWVAPRPRGDAVFPVRAAEAEGLPRLALDFLRLRFTAAAADCTEHDGDL